MKKGLIIILITAFCSLMAQGQNVGVTNAAGLTPQSLLHVHNTATGRLLQLTNANTGSAATDGFQISIDGSFNIVFNQYEAAKMAFYTNNLERVTILSDGNVGIGTASPGQKLEVSGITQSTGYRTTTGNTNYHHFTRSGGGAAVYINQADAINPVLRLSSGTETANANVIFTAENNGNIGIGTTTPTAKLHTTGTVRFAGYPSGANGAIVRTDASGNLATTNFTGNTSEILLGNNTFGTIATAGGVTSSCGAAYYIPKMSSNTVITCSQIYDNETNVGIGTSSPSKKLEVNGDIYNRGKLFQKTSDGQGSGAHGISWYDPAFVTWYDYMAPVGTTNSPSGTAAPTDASSGVTSWARRFNIENNAGYGWIFESGPNTAGTAPTAKFAISSNTGTFHSTGDAIIDGTVRAGANAVLGTNISGGYYQDATNGAYRSIVSSGTTNGYYFQTNAGAATTMYIGLGGTYNGNVGIGTTSPSRKLDVTGGIGATNQLYISKNNGTISNTAYNDGHIQLITTDNSYPRIGFHRSGTDAFAMYYAGGYPPQLRYRDAAGNDGLFWHSGNDGSGTTLDADLLDGQHGSYYSPTSHTHTLDNVCDIGNTTDQTIYSTNSSAFRVNNAAGNRSIYYDGNNYYSPVSHSGHSWFRNNTGNFTFQPFDDSDDWTRSFQLYLPDPGSSGGDNLVAELGQRVSNISMGSYKGLRIVHFSGSAVSDGFLQAGNAYFSGNVGIGTSTPADRLDVRDAMSVNEIKFRNVGGGDDSDPYRLRKVQGSSNTNWLELQLNDDNNEEFRIYGNSCSGYSCAEYSGNLYHFFRADGTAYHAGNVGIGTTSPSTQLHTTGGIRFQTLTGTGNRFVMTDASGNLSASSAPSANIVSGNGVATRVAFWSDANTLSSNANLYWDNTNSRLGIGTTIPAQGKLWVQNGEIWMTGDNNRIAFNTDNSSDGTPNASIFASQNGISGASADIVFKTWNGGADVEIMRVRSNGNVGIGTTSPAQKLHIIGTTRITDPYYSDRYIDIYGSAAQIIQSTNDLYIQPAGGLILQPGYPTSGTGNIEVKDGGGNVYTTFVGSTQRVGIGTSSPGYRLDLASGTFAFGNGNVRTETRNDAGLQGNSGAQSGFFETSSPSNYPSGATNWWHLIDCRHSNNSNNYALQIAGSFYDQNLYFRKTNNNSTQAWSQIMTSNNISGTTNYVAKFTSANAIGNSQIYDNGNVGIGTTSPTNLLDINTTSNTSGISLDGRVSLSSYNGDTWLRLNQSSSWTSGVYTPGFFRADGGIASGGISTPGAGNIGFSGTHISASTAAFVCDAASQTGSDFYWRGTNGYLSGSYYDYMILTYSSTPDDLWGDLYAYRYYVEADYYWLDIVNDLDAIDNMRPMLKQNKKTNRSELITDPNTIPSFLYKKNDNGNKYYYDLHKNGAFSIGAIRQLRQETKTAKQATDAKIDRLERIIEQLTGQQLSGIAFEQKATAFKDVIAFAIIDVRITKESNIIVKGISDYQITDIKDGSFIIRFSVTPTIDTEFTYSSEF